MGTDISQPSRASSPTARDRIPVRPGSQRKGTSPKQLSAGLPGLLPKSLFSPRRLWQAALVAGPVMALAVLGYRRRWLCDDGQIYLRPVRQILAGNGPVFNAGERAESSTGTLWQWLLALLTWMARADPGLVAVGTGLVLSTAGFALALAAACRLHRPEQPLLLPAGVFVLLAVPPMWDYMSSGLETGLSTCWIGGSWLLLVMSREGPVGRGRSHVTAFVFGLGPLIRPDLAVVSLCFLAALWLVERPSPRALLHRLGVALALPVAYEIFRVGYYGLLLPLPALTKEASASQWGRGAAYVAQTLGTYWLWPALVVLMVMAMVRVRTRPVVLAPLLSGTLLLLYVMRVGGDYMHARMVLPPLLLLLLPVLVVPATRATVAASVPLLLWAGTCVSPLRQPFEYETPKIPVAGALATDNVRSNDIAHVGVPHPVTSATWVQRWRHARGIVPLVREQQRTGRPVLVYFAAGGGQFGTPLALRQAHRLVVTGAYLGATGAAVPLDGHVVDKWSLANPVGAHFAARPGTVKPGHEKHYGNAWIFAEFTHQAVDDATLRHAGTHRTDVAAARRALHCGPLAELRASVQAPLTPQRFWSNLTGAYDRTKLRFSRVPTQAVEEMCASPTPASPLHGQPVGYQRHVGAPERRLADRLLGGYDRQGRRR